MFTALCIIKSLPKFINMDIMYYAFGDEYVRKNLNVDFINYIINKHKHDFNYKHEFYSAISSHQPKLAIFWYDKLEVKPEIEKILWIVMDNAVFELLDHIYNLDPFPKYLLTQYCFSFESYVSFNTLKFLQKYLMPLELCVVGGHIEPKYITDEVRTDYFIYLMSDQRNLLLNLRIFSENFKAPVNVKKLIKFAKKHQIYEYLYILDNSTDSHSQVSKGSLLFIENGKMIINLIRKKKMKELNELLSVYW